MARTARWLVATCLAFLVSCSPATTRLPSDFPERAVELERRTLADLAKRHPETSEALERAVGYAIFTNKATKVPMVGYGEGLGVAVDASDEQRHYLSVTHFDVGGGLGKLDYRLVIVFFDRADFERLRSGTLHLGASVEAGTGDESAGFGGSGRGTSKNKDRAVYVLSDSGATATWTVRLVRFVPLTEN